MNVFVSYDSHDELFASQLRSKLIELGIRVWNPSVELLPGSNWLLETGKALERADAVVFLVSHHSARSKWARFEMQYALADEKLEGRVVPVILDSETTHTPWILRRFAIKAQNQNANVVAQEIADRLKKTASERRSKKLRSTTKKKSASRRTTATSSRTARSR